MHRSSRLHHFFWIGLLALTTNQLWAFEQPSKQNEADGVVQEADAEDTTQNNTTAGEQDTTQDNATAGEQNITQDNAADTTVAPIQKPIPLDLIPRVDPDPLSGLDALVTKQTIQVNPYVPFIQSIAIGLDYGQLAMNAWQGFRKLKNKQHNPEQQYEGSLSILGRKNIQVATNFGYAHLYPSLTLADKIDYETMGLYGRVGVDYVARYGNRDNFYMGFRYGRSHFTNHTRPNNKAIKKISKPLTASWIELVIGTEKQLWQDHGFYGGIAFRIGYLYHFTKFAPANNYVIPGYGRTKNRPSVGLSLYIHYNLSFLNKQITFN